MKKNPNLDKIKKAIKDAAKDLCIHPSKVSQGNLTDFDPTMTEWVVRKYGGLASIKKSFPVEDKDLVSIKAQKDEGSYIKKLEKELADKQSLEQDIEEAIVQNIKPVKVKYYVSKKVKSTTVRHNVAMLNDTHIGLKVDKKEVDNLNEFNMQIASRRIAFYIDEVCKYKHEKRDEVEVLHLLLNGDLIAGIIHGLQGNDLYMLTHQFNAAVHIFTNAIAHCVQHYKQVKVYFSTGNHGDSPHRREGGRVLSQIYDSVEGKIFYAVSIAHRLTKNVEFFASNTLYQDFQLPAGRAAMTHGHLMFSSALGNPGTTVNTKTLGNAVSDFNVSQLRMKKEEVKLWMLGHCVTEDTELLTKDGWKTINTINNNTEFMTMNPDSQKLEYQKASALYIYPKEEYPVIHSLKNVNMDITATDKHGMIYYNYGNKDNPIYTELNNLPKRGWMRVSGYLDKPGVNLTDLELKLLVNIVTDGSFEKGKYLRFHYSKQRKIDNLISILEQLNIKYTKTTAKTGKTKIYVGRISDFLLDWIPNKTWNSKIKEMNHEQVDLFLNEYYITDGHQYNENFGQIYTSKKDQVNLLQEILFTSGYLTKFLYKKDNCYTLSIRKKELCMFSNRNIKEVKNTQNVWCVSVPNGSIVIRKNSKILVTQNTHCHFHITTKSGVQIYNAPSLSGLDSYALSIGVQNSLSAQVVFESTEKYIIGDSRLIHVQEADYNPEYDKIIPPYELELVYKK